MHTLCLGTSILVSLVVVDQTTLAQSTVGGVSGEVSVRVSNVCGASIPGAIVTLANQSGVAYRAAPASMGSYTFRGIPSTGDSWILTVESLGFEKERREGLRIKEGVPLAFDIRLLRDLTLKETVTVSDGVPGAVHRRYSVIGTITRPNGGPVSGATVTLRWIGSPDAISYLDRCTTDELGRYHLDKVLPTSPQWQLAVEAPGFAPYFQSPLELKPDEYHTINITLQPG
jgi:hypothetical protein